jgi:hypothetical protein
MAIRRDSLPVKRLTLKDVMTTLIDFQSFVATKFDAVDHRFDRIEATLVEHSQALNRLERRGDRHEERIEKIEQHLGL